MGPVRVNEREDRVADRRVRFTAAVTGNTAEKVGGRRPAPEIPPPVASGGRGPSFPFQG
jgi:hypothetical protein